MKDKMQDSLPRRDQLKEVKKYKELWDDPNKLACNISKHFPTLFLVWQFFFPYHPNLKSKKDYEQMGLN